MKDLPISRRIAALSRRPNLVRFGQFLLAAVLLYSNVSVPAALAEFSPASILPVPERLTAAGHRIADSRPAPVHGPAQPPSMAEALLTICEERGYSEDCARTLLGMAWKESEFKATAVGDGGRARGYFQIHFRLHGIPLECAQDLDCSANWTIDYLERNGYPRHELWAIQCHNGCGVRNGYAASVERHGLRLWAAATEAPAGEALAMAGRP